MAAVERAGEEVAQESADRLALAFEDAGFDVGQDFPALHDAIGRAGDPVVRIGDVRPAVADRLAAALNRQSGVYWPQL
ncbi:hypothetical protein AB0M02_34900 [Actinoplanes sp. NPDC051861]|uniref:hypothetical protein n=1 Tax=Actinoplanes sp. NPDC051861 TaxID=3155170 RepID=UPI003422E0F8